MQALIQSYPLLKQPYYFGGAKFINEARITELDRKIKEADSKYTKEELFKILCYRDVENEKRVKLVSEEADTVIQSINKEIFRLGDENGRLTKQTVFFKAANPGMQTIGYSQRQMHKSTERLYILTAPSS